MVALFVSCWLMAAHYLPGLAQGAPASPPPVVATASEKRMFDIHSLQAWDVIQQRLREIGFTSDKTDRANQVVLTKWRDVADKGLEWLPAAALPQPYVARRVRFVVFVSPFAQPARVSVGSLIEATMVGNSAAGAVGYNDKNVNKALMLEIAKALGQDGLPIPADDKERQQLALSVLKDRVDDCLRHGPPPNGPAGIKLARPEKIRLSEFEILYPAAAIGERTEGTVRVGFRILEDGGVTDIRILDPAIDRQLGASAIGAVSLLLFSPLRINGCSLPTFGNYSVRYRIK